MPVLRAGGAGVKERVLRDRGAVQADRPQYSGAVLAMTHEEAGTFHVAQLVPSYRDLPLIPFYSLPDQERDEPQPRAGCYARGVHQVKDSTPSIATRRGSRSYELHVGAYDRIMERTDCASIAWSRTSG